MTYTLLICLSRRGFGIQNVLQITEMIQFKQKRINKTLYNKYKKGKIHTKLNCASKLT